MNPSHVFTHGLSLTAADIAEIRRAGPGVAIQCDSRNFVPLAPILPDPRTPAGGYESVDWSGCRLAQLYGVPGDIRCGQRRSKLR